MDTSSRTPFCSRRVECLFLEFASKDEAIEKRGFSFLGDVLFGPPPMKLERWD